MRQYLKWAQQRVKKKYPRFYAAALVLFGKNAISCSRLIAAYIDRKEVLQFHCLGKRNDNKLILLISVGDTQIDGADVCTRGFFALLGLDTIRNLDMADRLGLIPYISWGKDVVYSENELIRGTDNVFEYYFEQVSQLTKEEVLHSKHVCFSHELKAGKLMKKGSLYNLDEWEIDRCIYLYRKYIRLNVFMQEYIENEIKKLALDDRTLAVHIRGVEWGEIKNHPIPVLLEAYMQHIDRLLSSNEYHRIFIATDSEETIRQMTFKYGEKIVFYTETNRTPSGSKKLIIFDEKQKNKKNGKYSLGVEVVRDMLSLAACGGLVAGVSNVSFFARCAKRSEGNRYKDEIILDNGLLTEKGKDPKTCIENQ